MLSTVPAFSFSEPGLVNQFSGFQTGFPPWEMDRSDLFSVNQLTFEPAVPSPCYGESDTGSVRIDSGYHDMKAGSDEICDGFVKTKPGSDDADGLNGLLCSHAEEPDSDDQKHRTTIANFGLDEQNHKLRQPEMTEEKKRKRMESNRESARRSRRRKQNHIDNLKNQVNELDLQNRELGNRLRLVLHQLQQVNINNNRLVTEQEILRQRLSHMRRILIIRQLQQQQQYELYNRRMIMAEQNQSSIIDQIIH